MINHIRIPLNIYKLPVRGLYESSILALVYNFADGFRLSNDKTAKLLSTDKRTIERAISRLKKAGLVRDIGTGKNDRCLVFDTDTMPADTDIMSAPDTDTMSAGIPTLRGADTDMTADHNRIKNNQRNTGENPKDIFDLARRQYPGTKRGLDTELKDFRKHTDWRACLPLLLTAIKAEAAHKAHLQSTGQFCPAWPHFRTWLYQRRWEAEYPDVMAGVTREADESEIDNLLGVAI